MGLKRLKVLRGQVRYEKTRGGDAGAIALGVYDPARDLVADVLPWPGAHDHERSRLEPLMPEVEPGQLWVPGRGDRG